MTEFIEALENEFENNSNAKIALDQKAYLRNQFEFYGMPAGKRKEIQKQFFIKEYRPRKSELKNIVIALWDKPQREYHYFSQELVLKYVKEVEEKDIKLFEFMVTHKSWWDTVDFIANKLMGAYFKTYPNKKHMYVQKWLESNNMWLQRSALLFQLKYHKDLDTGLLSIVINSVKVYPLNGRLFAQLIALAKAIL